MGATAAPEAAQHLHRQGPLEEHGAAAALCFVAGVTLGPALRLNADVGVEGEAALFALELIRQAKFAWEESRPAVAQTVSGQELATGPCA